MLRRRRASGLSRSIDTEAVGQLAGGFDLAVGDAEHDHALEQDRVVRVAGQRRGEVGGGGAEVAGDVGAPAGEVAAGERGGVGALRSASPFGSVSARAPVESAMTPAAMSEVSRRGAVMTTRSLAVKGRVCWPDKMAVLQRCRKRQKQLRIASTMHKPPNAREGLNRPC